MLKHLRITLPIFLIVMTLSLMVAPTAFAADECTPRTLAAARATPGVPINLGPFNLKAGEGVEVRGTDLVGLSGYTIVVFIDGAPAAADTGVFQAKGESAVLSGTVENDVTVTIQALLTSGGVFYHINVFCPDAGSTDTSFTGGSSGIGAGDTNGAVYVDPDGIFVYGVGANSNGYVAASIRADELATIPCPTGSNQLLAQSPDGLFSIYYLTSCEYQVNIGPFNGKVTETIFDGIPPTYVKTSEFFVTP